MFTSDKNINKKLSTTIKWVIVTSFCALFGGIYELFSHQVYSYYMIYAFVIPLCLGVIPSLFIKKHKIVIKQWAQQLYRGGVIALTISSILKGVLEIYGTTNRKLIILTIAGSIMIIVSALAIININRCNAKKNGSKISDYD